MLICIIPVAFLLLMQVDPVSVFVPVGSSLLAASFVFAPSVQNFVTCLIFVLIQHPYDVGDVVRKCPVALCLRMRRGVPLPRLRRPGPGTRTRMVVWVWVWGAAY